VFTDDGFSVAAAGWAEPTLALWKETAAEILIGADPPYEHPRGALPRGWSCNVRDQDREKHDGDDEHRSPSPT